MNVDRIMTPDPVICRADDTLNVAAQAMWTHDIGALPVVDPNGRAIGMITDRDICMAAYTQGRPLAEVRVDDAMSEQLHAVKRDTPIPAAESLMQQQQVRRLPVVDDAGKIVGIVSLNDLARRTSSAKGAVVSEHELAQTLQAICTPRDIPARVPMVSVG